MAYEDAVDSCNGFHGWLVTVNNEDENIFFNDTFGTNFWIGYNDRAAEGQYVWVHDTGSTYTNWALGEPNNAGGQDCALFSVDGKWTDEDCTDIHEYVCGMSPAFGMIDINVPHL